MPDPEPPLCAKLHPSRFPGISGEMAAIIGFILDRQFVDPPIWEMTVTGDGLLLARVGAQRCHQTFLGVYADVVQNWKEILMVAGLTPEEHFEALCQFAARVGFWGEPGA
jgi:hypothetical protein